jgi:hypothetical protein
VEFAGEPARNPRVADLASRGFFLADMAFEFGAEYRPPARDQEANNFALEHPANLEHLFGFLERRLGCGRGPSRRRVDQPFGALNPAEDLPRDWQRGIRDPRIKSCIRDLIRRSYSRGKPPWPRRSSNCD